MADKKRTVSEKRSDQRAKADIQSLNAIYGFGDAKKDTAKKPTKKK